MIITAGQYKGFRLKSPKGLTTRPTTSRVKQAVFNICRSKVSDSFFLDIYAGSGQMGIEALSQGAKFAVFVERDRDAISCIKKNIESLSIENKTKIIPKDIFQLKNISFKFDLVFIDPPYRFYEEKNFLQKNLAHLEPFLNDEALIFMEAPYSKNLDLEKIEVKNFGLQSLRKYGSGYLIIFEYLPTKD
jgi:16S rRNA (guanine966-N2)-methyltransferase